MLYVGAHDVCAGIFIDVHSLFTHRADHHFSPHYSSTARRVLHAPPAQYSMEKNNPVPGITVVFVGATNNVENK